MDDESLVRMERILLATWPPLEVEERDGWVAGANGGFTGRANSLTVLRRTDPAAAHDLAGWAEDWYAQRQAPPAIRVTPLSENLKPVLAERGWEWWRNGASVMVGNTLDLTAAEIPAGYTADGAVMADAEWYELSGHDADAQNVLNAMFDGTSPISRHVSIRHEDSGMLAAIGRGVVSDGHLAIFGMETAPAHRRRGLATAVIGDLARWATGLDADRVTLQVEVGNDRAHSLYETLGFDDVYEYGYLALLA